MTVLSDSRAFNGIYASTVCPMHEDGRIATDQLERHMAEVAACPGIRGLLVNGHAGENALLSRTESREVLELARRAAPDGLIVAGVNAENTDDAVDLARDAERAGADVIMVFPPFSWSLGLDRRAIVDHHRRVAAATALPIMLFQASVHSGQMNFSAELLAELLALPQLVGIKEGSWETAAYERTRRLTRRLRPDVAVMASGDEHLFACFAIGSDGSLVSLAAVVPELIVALDTAVRAGDLVQARRLNDRIYPLAQAVYADAPAGLVAARLKVCLALAGRLTAIACKAPVGRLNPAEIDHIAAALDAAGVEAAPRRRREIYSA